MERIDIKRIKFGSFIKFICTICIMLGITVGLFTFIIGLFQENFYVNLRVIEFTGKIAGGVSIVLSTLLCALFGAILSIFSYLPFKLYLKIFKKIEIYGSFKRYQINEIAESDHVDKKDEKDEKEEKEDVMSQMSQ
ncbi:hypothetical protein [Clostridium formicaceticum]|uniref:Uncharacterized protein n=1 Tax=Clostridium formicaceticum TaxID=1497 RepID=A0AAC9RJ23_9CLOT|nr:hypothetical protein [Clostridium formicaceticum]AOY76563.1 hypothetical protein BJL90_12260 [Clostridium formicaceticum]ARE86981.1 hypothetical protein CLFO_13660 [Clostridium formicaceticum]